MSDVTEPRIVEVSQREPELEASKVDPTTAAGAPGRKIPGARLRTDRGVTVIAEGVVATIAALATREVPGVQAMGKGMARAFGALRSRVPGGTGPNTSTQGIVVEVGERQAAIDIDIVAYYGPSVIETTQAVRANVIERLESMTGLDVVEVNVNVNDLYFDSTVDAVGGDEVVSRVL